MATRSCFYDLHLLKRPDHLFPCRHPDSSHGLNTCDRLIRPDERLVRSESGLKITHLDVGLKAWVARYEWVPALEPFRARRSCIFEELPQAEHEETEHVRQESRPQAEETLHKLLSTVLDKVVDAPASGRAPERQHCADGMGVTEGSRNLSKEFCSRPSKFLVLSSCAVCATWRHK